MLLMIVQHPQRRSLTAIAAEDMDSASISACAEACEGFSFAQFQEAYIFAGQFAFDEERSVAAKDILTAVNTLRKSLQGADWKGEGASGFKVERR